MQITIETSPTAPGRAYDFNKGDRRVGGDLDRALDVAEDRTLERGVRQVVRATSWAAPETKGWLIQDVDETAVARPECVRLAADQQAVHYTDGDGDRWVYVAKHDVWVLNSGDRRSLVEVEAQAAQIPQDQGRRGREEGLRQIQRIYG